jgi:hypothetical protein
MQFTTRKGQRARNAVDAPLAGSHSALPYSHHLPSNPIPPRHPRPAPPAPAPKAANPIDAAISLIPGWNTKLSADERNTARRWMAVRIVTPTCETEPACYLALGALRTLGIVGRWEGGVLIIPASAWTNRGSAQ